MPRGLWLLLLLAAIFLGASEPLSHMIEDLEEDTAASDGSFESSGEMNQALCSFNLQQIVNFIARLAFGVQGTLTWCPLGEAFKEACITSAATIFIAISQIAAGLAEAAGTCSTTLDLHTRETALCGGGAAGIVTPLATFIAGGSTVSATCDEAAGIMGNSSKTSNLPKGVAVDRRLLEFLADAAPAGHSDGPGLLELLTDDQGEGHRRLFASSQAEDDRRLFTDGQAEDHQRLLALLSSGQGEGPRQLLERLSSGQMQRLLELLTSGQAIGHRRLLELLPSGQAEGLQRFSELLSGAEGRRRLLQLLTDSPDGQAEGRGGEPDSPELPDEGVSETLAPSTSAAPTPPPSTSSSAETTLPGTSQGPAEVPPDGTPGPSDALREDLSAPWQESEGSIDTTSGAMSMGQLATAVSQAVSACPVAGAGRRLQQAQAQCTREISFAIFSLSRIITFLSLAVVHLAPDDVPYAIAQCCAGVSQLAGSVASAVSYSAQIYADCVVTSHTSSTLPTPPTTTTTTTQVPCSRVPCRMGTVPRAKVCSLFGSTPQECCEEACSGAPTSSIGVPTDQIDYFNPLPNGEQIGVSRVNSCWQENCRGWNARDGVCGTDLNPLERLPEPFVGMVTTGWDVDHSICCQEKAQTLIGRDIREPWSCETTATAVCADTLQRCICVTPGVCDYPATCLATFSTCPYATPILTASLYDQTVCQASCLQCKVPVCQGGCKCWEKPTYTSGCFCRRDKTAEALIGQCPWSPYISNWIDAALGDSSIEANGLPKKSWCAASPADVCTADPGDLGRCLCDSSLSQCQWPATCAAAVVHCPRSDVTARYCKAAGLVAGPGARAWCAAAPADVCSGRCVCDGTGVCQLAETSDLALRFCGSGATNWCSPAANKATPNSCSSTFGTCVTVCGDDASYLIPKTLGFTCGSSGGTKCPVKGQQAAGKCDPASVGWNTSDPLNWGQAPEDAVCVNSASGFHCQYPSHPCSRRRLEEEAGSSTAELAAGLERLRAEPRSAAQRTQVRRLHEQLWYSLGFNVSDPAALWLTEEYPSIRRIVDQGRELVAKIQGLHAQVPEVLDVDAPMEAPAREQPAAKPRADAETLQCSSTGSYYRPFGLRGQPMSTEVNVAACQARCALVPGCAYFSFYVPKSHCHLHDVLAEAAADSQWVSGLAGCRPEHLSEATQRLLERTGSCYFQHASYELRHAVAEPVIVQSALQCQQRCQQVVGCAHFSYAAGTGLCHMVKPGARRLAAVVFSMAGPRRCSSASLISRAALQPGHRAERFDGSAAAAGVAVVFAVVLSTAASRALLRGVTGSKHGEDEGAQILANA